MNVAFIVLVGVIAFALKRQVRTKVISKAGTWDCGYAQPTTRIQYTGSSFGQTVVTLFAFILWPKTHWPTIRGFFPKTAHFKTIVPDTVLDRLVLPLFNLAGRYLPSLRVLQQGQTPSLCAVYSDHRNNFTYLWYDWSSIMTDTIIHILLLLTLPPLLLGVINKTKAWFGGRKGPPVLQTYYDIIKLMRKGMVLSRTTTWVFIAGPVVTLATVLLAGMLIPIGQFDAPIAFAGDLIPFCLPLRTGTILYHRRGIGYRLILLREWARPAK